MAEQTFQIRPALHGDYPRIRALIYAVKINPMNLDWRRFFVAVSPEGDLVGCGQVKPHRDGSLELASIAVADAWRGRGIARDIIQALLLAHPGELYLTCRSRFAPFYEKFGFQVIGEAQLPPYFRKISRLARVFSSSGLIPGDLLVMRRAGTK
jgi:N-acetylglutamate synthase-like GNAT family acetyltransferase